LLILEFKNPSAWGTNVAQKQESAWTTSSICSYEGLFFQPESYFSIWKCKLSTPWQRGMISSHKCQHILCLLQPTQVQTTNCLVIC
jgi:hypothetical protein